MVTLLKCSMKKKSMNNLEIHSTFDLFILSVIVNFGI